MKKIALLGCGAIGTEIAKAIDSGKIPALLTHIYDSDEKKSQILAQKLGKKPKIVDNAHLLSSNDTDIVVEAASQDAIKNYALSILQNKKDLMVMSVGALLDESVFEVLLEACREFKKKIYLPSGAIAGLDGIRAVRPELDSLTLVTTKHPKTLAGAKFFETDKIDLSEISKPTTLYEGPASEAVRLFPANINVAALLSLAGLGKDTRVKIIADPNTDKNTHKIEASGKFGKIIIEAQNVPDQANPKTSRLAILSAIECLRAACSDDIRIGT